MLDRYALAFIVLAICVVIIAWTGMDAIFEIGIATGKLECK